MKRHERTLRNEEEILESPTTRKLVHKILDLVGTSDIVNASFDLKVALQIINGRIDRQLEV